MVIPEIPINLESKHMSTNLTLSKHLVLVHGLSHGAWCWYKVVSHLRSAGYRVTTVDLAGSGVHPSRLEDIATFSDYIQPLIRLLESLSADDQRVVLVGHSYGGLAIALAMERFSHVVSAAVFISAYMPNYRDPPALQMKQDDIVPHPCMHDETSNFVLKYFQNLKPEMFMDCRFTFNKNGLPASAELGGDYIATMMYQNCQPEDLALATMLIRPSAFYFEDMSKDSLLTKEKYGSTSRVYIVCEGDQVMEEEFQRFVIKDSPPNEVKSFQGAGHMIMLSKAKDLTVYLQEIASRYP